MNNFGEIDAGPDSAGNTIAQSFGYDNLNRISTKNQSLVSSTGGVTPQGANVYTLDPADNFKQTTLSGSPGDAPNQFGVNALNEVTSAVTSAGSATWVYNDNGSLVSDGFRSYGWDARNRLVSVTYSDGSKTLWSYDGLDRRASMVEGAATSRYRWCGEELCGVFSSQGMSFMYGDRGEYSAGTGTAMAYSIDQLGSVRHVNDASTGAWKLSLNYEAFGSVSASPCADTNACKLIKNANLTKGYAGLQWHANSGLYLGTYRAYMPGAGRWINRDPVEERGGINLYAYVGGNPVSLDDPLGLYPAVLVTLPDGSQYIPLTQVKNAAQASSYGLPMGALTAIAVPPGVDPMAQINGWSGGNSLGPGPFAWYWRPGGPNDYKLQNAMYDAYGNFAYGATGAASGQYTCGVLTGIGDMLHNGHNNPINTRDITLGFSAVNRGGVLSIIDYNH